MAEKRLTVCGYVENMNQAAVLLYDGLLRLLFTIK